MSQRLQVIRRDVIPWILPPRPAGPDRHPAPALAGEAGLATSPRNYTTDGKIFFVSQDLKICTSFFDVQAVFTKKQKKLYIVNPDCI